MLGNVVHLAHVTADLEWSGSVFRDDQGVREFTTFDSLQLPTVGGGEAVINWGLTYGGDLQFDVVRLVSGEVDVYRALLPERSDQFVLRGHHIASQLDSTAEYDAVMAGYRQRGHRMALEASFGGPGSLRRHVRSARPFPGISVDRRRHQGVAGHPPRN